MSQQVYRQVPRDFRGNEERFDYVPIDTIGVKWCKSHSMLVDVHSANIGGINCDIVVGHLWLEEPDDL